MKTTTIAVTAASMLASVGLAASFAPAARAATPTSTRSVQALKKTSAALDLTVTGKQRIAAVHGAATTTTTTTAGAVTFVENYLAGPAVVVETVSQNGTKIGTIALGVGTYSAPQILPVGTYTVSVTDQANPTDEVASDVVTVTAATDSSDVLAPAAGGDFIAALTEFADPATSVPANQTVVSLRNTASNAAGGVDVYVDNALVASDVLFGQAKDVTLTPGPHTVAVYMTGSTSSASLVYSGSLDLVADTYVPTYVIDDPGDTANAPTGFVVASTPFTLGYQFTASDGGVFTYGGFPFHGSTGSLTLNKPVVGGAESASGGGYYLVASDGGVFAFGDAPFEGSTGAMKLNSPIVGIAATTNDNGTPGYLLVAADGGVFAFNAHFYGSLGGQTLTAPVVGIAADPSTGGYVIAEADGSFTQFGPGITPTPTAPFALNKPIVGVAETPDGGGAWLVASDGGVFNTGDAQFFGSTGALKLNKPIVGISSTFDGLGYSLIASDGGVFTYGDSGFYGSTGSLKLNKPIVAGIN